MVLARRVDSPEKVAVAVCSPCCDGVILGADPAGWWSRLLWVSSEFLEAFVAVVG